MDTYTLPFAKLSIDDTILFFGPVFVSFSPARIDFLENFDQKHKFNEVWPKSVPLGMRRQRAASMQLYNCRPRADQEQTRADHVQTSICLDNGQ